MVLETPEGTSYMEEIGSTLLHEISTNKTNLGQLLGERLNNGANPNVETNGVLLLYTWQHRRTNCLR
jgi:hypothetical protein